MARINLLPWRAERQKQRQKNFFMMLALSAVAGLGFWFLVNSYYNSQISGQIERNAFLDQEIKAVEVKIAEIKELEDKKAKLLARKRVIEELQGNRSQMVHLFDTLVRTIPDGVILTGIKQEGQKLTLEGRSQSNARVSTYMRNFEGSTWMTKPELSIIEAKGEDKGLPYAFKLTVTLTNPNDAKEKEKAAIAATAGATTTATLPALSPAQPAAGQPVPGAAPTTAPTAAPAPAPAKPENTATPPAGGAKS